MKSAEPIKREYYKSDRVMLAQSRRFYWILQENLSKFSEKFSIFTPEYVANMDALITEAELYPTRSLASGVSKANVMLLQEKVRDAKRHYMKLINYVKLLYPDNRAVLTLFGYNEYEESIRTPYGINSLLLSAFEKANSLVYKGDLVALGFTESDILLLFTLAEEVYAIHLEQSAINSSNKLITEQRVTLYNQVWAIMRKISSVAEEVFPDSYARQRNLRLYPKVSKSKKIVPEQEPVIQESVPKIKKLNYEAMQMVTAV